jgi:N-acetylglucosaminyldiphosphoundecaprenol N-acetyl-beta-D-mannosaminyltransferase
MVHERVKRISILRVPVDIVAPDDLETVIESMYQDGRNHQIVLLSFADFMKSRWSGEYRTMLAGSSLVLPITLSIIRAARFLKRPSPYRYEPFDFIVRLLAILERKNQSVYLLGARPIALVRAEKNIRDTFPGLRIVGRHSSDFRRAYLPRIIQAIRKATPTALLVGNGIPGAERWIPRNLKHFNSGIFVWCSDVFEVFAEKRKRPPVWLFNAGLEWLFYLPRHPWRLVYFVTVLWYDLLLLWYRIMGR